MPIDKASKEWEEGKRFDYVQIRIRTFLSDNEDMAFTSEEIAEHIVKNEWDAIPKQLQDVAEDDMTPVISYISSVLQHMNWRSQLEARIPESDEENIYYTMKSDAKFPLADVFDNFPRRFDNVESRIDELEDKVRQYREEARRKR